MDARTTQSTNNDQNAPRPRWYKTRKGQAWGLGGLLLVLVLFFWIRGLVSGGDDDQVAQNKNGANGQPTITLTQEQYDALKAAGQNKPVDGGAGQQQVASTSTLMTGSPLITPTTIIFKDGHREFGYTIQEITPPTAVPVNK